MDMARAKRDLLEVMKLELEFLRNGRTSLNFGSCPTGNVHSVQGEAPV
jgi:hypothetical protein